MDSLPTAMIISQRLMSSTVHSALPDAPVIPDAPRRTRTFRIPRAARTRTRLSQALDRAARAVAPAPSCNPVP